MLRATVLALLLGTGCVQAELVACGDLICPAGAVCIEGNRCATTQAVADCTDKTSGESCTVDNLAGRCTDRGDVRVCEPAACGDGVIDQPLREECDGTAAFATQCVDLGYDLGLPSCGTACELDAAACTRFGWTLQVDAPVIAMWTDGTVMAYAQRSPDRLVVQGGGFAVSAMKQVSELDGGGGKVFVLSEGNVLQAGATATTDLMDGSFTRADHITVDAAGIVYALAGCSVWKHAGAWTLVASGGVACNDLFAAPGDRLFVQRSNEVIEEVAGGLFTPRFRADSPIHAMRFTATGAWVGSTNTLGYWDGTALRPDVVHTGDVRSLALSGSQVFAGLSDGHVVRVGTSHPVTLTPPTAFLIDDGAGGVYSYGGPIYRYSGTAFGDLPPVPASSGQQVAGSSIAADGTLLVASSNSAYTLDGTTGWRTAGAGLEPFRAISARSLNDFVVVAHFDGIPLCWVDRFTNGTRTSHQRMDGATTLSGVWMSADGAIAYAAGTSAAGGWLGSGATGGAWTSQEPAGCAFHAVDGRGTRVIAAGSCAGSPVLWELSGATWSEVRREAWSGAFRGVRLLANGDVFATGDEGTAWQVNGAWNSDLSVRGHTLSGAAGDMWISGSFTPILHWDGTAWSKMTTRPLGAIAIAATPALVVMPGAGLGHVSLLRE